MRLYDCQPGEYLVVSMSKSMNNDFLTALNSIGFSKGQIIFVLKNSTRKNLFIEMNEAEYLLRRENTKDVEVKKI